MRWPHSLVVCGLAALTLASASLLGGCPSAGGGGPVLGGGGGLFNLPPSVVLTADITRGVAPLLVRFNSSGSTDDGVIVERRWEFGDGVTSIEIAPAHIYLTTGEFVVRLTLTDDAGAQSFEEITISVTERPVAIINVSGNTAAQAPATFTFDGSASFDPDAREGDELLYDWDFDDGSRDFVATLDHTFARAGTFRVQLTVTDGTGITGTATEIIEVGIPVPTATLRTPPPEQSNIVFTNRSPLWTHLAFDVEPGVPYFLRAGLDGDNDPCNSLTTLYVPSNGNEIRRLSGHANAVRTAAYSPDATRIISGSDDGTVRMHSVSTGALIRAYSIGHGAVNALAYSPDGVAFVVGCADGAVALYDGDPDAEVPLIRDDFVGHTSAVNAIAYSPRNNQILSGDQDGIAILWSAEIGVELTRITHANPVRSVDFWPVNPQALATGTDDETARIWSAVDGEIIQQFGPVFSGGEQIAGHTDSVLGVRFSSDGLRLATCSADGTAKVWNVLSGAEVRTFTGHEDAVIAIGFSPDDLQLITGSADGSARIWDVASGANVHTLQPCLSPITAVQYASDGLSVLAAVASENDLQLDTFPPQGNDMNLTLPTPLNLLGVPAAVGGQRYFFWAEIDTDRTEPSRSYARLESDGATRYNHVHLIPALTVDTTSAPLVPLRTVTDPDLGLTFDETAVVVPAISPTDAAPRRRVFDIGPVQTGDELRVTLLSMPGYGRSFIEPGYSLQLLDGENTHFAWMQDTFTSFDQTTRLIVGHDSDHMYISTDNAGSAFVSSVHVRVFRQLSAGPPQRKQTVFLMFGAVANVAVRGSLPAPLPAFSAGTVPAQVMDAIVARLETLFAPYNVEFVRSDLDPTPSSPYTTVYFDTDEPSAFITLGGVDADQLLQFGAPDTSDPRNQTLGGHAIVVVTNLLDAYPALSTDNARGIAIGNAAAHQLGLLFGLRQTDGTTDVMGENANLAGNLQFDTSPVFPNLVGLGGVTPIGTQNGHQVLLEVMGTP